MDGMNGKSATISGPWPLPSTFFSLLHSTIRRFTVWTNEEQREMEADYSGGQSSPWVVASRGRNCHMYEWLQMGFGFVAGFIENLQIINMRNYSTSTNSHTLQFTITHTKSSQSAVSSLVIALWQIPTMSCTSMLTFLPTGECPTSNSFKESELLYNWWFSANLFVLMPSPLRITTRDFLTEPLRS
jgi:hypothetical protein